MAAAIQRRTTAARTGSHPRPGFTLVELTLAAALLAISLVVLANSTQYVRNQGMARHTRDLLAQASQALAAYHARHDAWPPDRFTRDTVQPTDSHRPDTEGVECLVRALARSDLSFWKGAEFERSLANVDGDANKIDGAPLEELVDGWGRPLLYYHGYGAGAAGAPTSLPAFERISDARMRRLSRALADRWIHNDRRPLLDSAGPDGTFNNSDDERMTGQPSDDEAVGDLR
ncbi:MAG: hypothetical protein PHU85_09135 [Phycisphaerae bacterium]|nr:hypothetical protein [Phycisphaerae bacterium]